MRSVDPILKLWYSSDSTARNLVSRGNYYWLSTWEQKKPLKSGAQHKALLLVGVVPTSMTAQIKTLKEIRSRYQKMQQGQGQQEKINTRKGEPMLTIAHHLSRNPFQGSGTFLSDPKPVLTDGPESVIIEPNTAPAPSPQRIGPPGRTGRGAAYEALCRGSGPGDHQQPVHPL